MTKVHVKDSNYMAKRGSFFQGSIKIDGDFLLGTRSTIWGNLVVAGNLYLMSECQINGNVTCAGGVIGRGTVVTGTFTTTQENGSLTVCDGAKINVISSSGDVYLRPDVTSAEVFGNNILVQGKVHCGRLMGKNTRVISNQS